MKAVLAILSLASLVATIGPPLVYLAGKMELSAMKTTMLAATISWFVFAALWIYGGGEVEHDIEPAEHAPIVP